jgi:NAD(P)-dependent dehydrogenase (short-subunit alcohol dehydrogenase family)
MKEFRDRVAVVTGAASGIGRALADRCAREGMKVVLADVQPAALELAEAELRASGATVRAVVTDVSKPAAVEALAQKTLDSFGGVHLLCSNAGVGWGGPVWQNSLSDWEWLLGVNLWGVVHGIRAFVPRMLAQETECHIVNTASVAGLVPGQGAYGVSKHAVVALSEALHQDLAALGAKVGVSVLCPGYVNTRLLESSFRNRPPERAEVTPELMLSEPAWKRVRERIEAGIAPDRVAEQVFAAMREDRFYILTHPVYRELIQARLEAILEGRPPADLRGFFDEKGEY